MHGATRGTSPTILGALISTGEVEERERERAEAGVIPGYFGGDHVGLSEVVDETLPKGLHSSPLLSSSLLPVSVSISAIFFFCFHSVLKSFSPPAPSSFLAPQRLLPPSHKHLEQMFLYLL